MNRSPSTPRRPTRGRPRGRANDPASHRAPRHTPTTAAGASEPPPKRRKYIPGGPGGGGRFVDETGAEVPTRPAAPATAPRTRGVASSITTPSHPRRERSERIRIAVNRDPSDDVPYSSAAAVAAAVVQSEGYKPREERGWEEFHPNLDIEATFMVFRSDDVDGITKPDPSTPAGHGLDTPVNGANTPSKDGTTAAAGGSDTPTTEQKPLENPFLMTPRRRVGRPPRDPVSFYGAQMSQLGLTPRTPQVLPIHNQTPKERLDLKQPSYRKTDRILLFESKTFGQARYVDKSMMNVGYQESDDYIRPERVLLKASDANGDEELDIGASSKSDGSPTQNPPAGVVGRVEYDMDEQDDMWLEKLNAQRRPMGLIPITREIFEITITKIEKEWHALEKRIPKPNPKPPQTHRPRSSSAAAVNGEPQAGEEQDSKCAICDDGDCENTNAIVFCDGCDLAVHQECYGVPFIPEGQWLCRKCQLIGRGVPTCIFCPNTDGAFKQTNSSKWAHLLCAMWIPEVSLGNHTFMEPVMEVEKVPKNRWKLTCYICNQRMGACIQCSNKNCYQAFHVTCARRGRLYLKMKNSQGALAVLDGAMLLKAFCDRHCPQDYAKENSVAQATKQAKRFYKRTMKGRIWVDNQASAAQLAATHRHAITEHPPDESQMTGAKLSAVLADKKKGGQPGKPIWKLPSGAPVIPQAVYDIVESSLQRFPIGKRKEFVAEACRYWTLKREARRGAALLKRLQLQMDTFSSMELTRRNFAAMGPSGKARLTRRIEFARNLVEDMERLKALSQDIVHREATKLEAAEMGEDFVDSCYFPVYKMLIPVIDKTFALDKDVFKEGLTGLQRKLDRRFYTTTLAFAHDLCEVIHVGINTPPKLPVKESRPESSDAVSSKQNSHSEPRDRKRLGKRILKSVQPQLEAALRAEADLSKKPLDVLLKELDGMLEASLEPRQRATTVAEDGQDITMADAGEEGQIIVAGQVNDGGDVAAKAEPDAEDGTGPSDGLDADAESADKMDVDRSPHKVNGHANANISESEEVVGKNETLIPAVASASVSVAGDGLAHQKPDHMPGGANGSSSSPTLNGYTAGVQPPHQADPLTPPQSNGSLGHGAATTDALSEGGLPWYLKGFEVVGTTATEEQWAGREAVRSLSEELTDLDDEALRDLEFDVDDETINASPVNAAIAAGAETQSTPTSSSKKRASPTKPRKGLRSSARKR